MTNTEPMRCTICNRARRLLPSTDACVACSWAWANAVGADPETKARLHVETAAAE